MKTAVFGAGQIHDYARVRSVLNGAELIVCADGGVRHALALGMTPSLVVGDFDSAGPALAEEIAARGIPVTRVAREKDQTDMHLALDEAVRRGATDIVLSGATGDRLDHTLGNLLLLPGVSSGPAVTVVDAKNIVRLLRPGGRLTVSGAPGDLISLLPLTPEAKGVVIEGVKWPLDNTVLRWGQSLGISNEFTESEAFVAVREGYLLVIQAWD